MTDVRDETRRILTDGMARRLLSRAPIALARPSLPGNPIADVNDAFERAVGHAGTAAIGRSGRFLRGAVTDRGPCAGAAGSSRTPSAASESRAVGAGKAGTAMTLDGPRSARGDC